MRIGFISDFSFPIGMASTNRIMSLAKGIIYCNNRATVFITKPTENPNHVVNKKHQGSYNRIDYIYTTGSVIRPASRVKLLFTILKGFLGFFIHFNSINKKDKFDFVISSSPKNYFFNFIYIIYLRFKGTIPVLAIDEFPYVVRHKEKYSDWYSEFILKHYYRQFDGFVIMTNTLIDYFKPLIKPSSFIIHLPMTVEVERFVSNTLSSPVKGNYIAYSGSFINNKDGIPILIKAFDLVRKDFTDIKLVIIGGGNIGEGKELLSFKNLVNELRLTEYVIFTGQISRDDIPRYLNNATVLALARPNNIQAKGGFPTKLGEYLATGNPVVVTKVGEIPLYLKDGENAFLAEPDCVICFADKLKEALRSVSKSKIVGSNGKRLAENEFSHIVQAKRLDISLKEILNGNVHNSGLPTN